MKITPLAGKVKILACSAVMLLATNAAYSDVFSLWPYGRHDGKSLFSGKDNSSDVLSSRRLKDEKIIINGYKSTLSVAIVDMQLADAAGVLRKSFPSASFAANKNSILMEQDIGNKKIRRTYLLSLPGVEGLIQFSMELPSDVKKNGRASWNKNLPLISGAEEITSIYLPDRKAFYGTYGVRGMTKGEMLSSLSAKLRADGWTGVSGEDAYSIGGSGEVYMKGDGSSVNVPVLVLGMTDAFDGKGMQAAFYLKNAMK